MYSNLNKFVSLISLLVCCEIAGRVVSGFQFCRIVQGKGPRHNIKRNYYSNVSQLKSKICKAIFEIFWFMQIISFSTYFSLF